MREIKFRGKNKDLGWVYGQLAFDINGNAYIIQNVEMDSSYGIEETMLFATMWYRVDKNTIGQYTGLHDKDGKEIYEGDIVEVTRPCIYEKGLVIFKNGCFFIKAKETLLALYECEINNYTLKVIDNIYDNPELLEG